MKIIFVKEIRNYSRCKEEEIPYQPTLGELLEFLSAKHGEKFRRRVFNRDATAMRRDMVIVANEKFIIDSGTELGMKLSPDDTLSIHAIPACG